ncbi:MAG TPA: hypothetical protein VFZ56_04500, partial [Gemmatimonadaceae bacterium]
MRLDTMTPETERHVTIHRIASLRGAVALALVLGAGACGGGGESEATQADADVVVLQPSDVATAQLETLAQ